MIIYLFPAQGKVSDVVSEIYDIKYDFVGSVFSNMAKVRNSSFCVTKIAMLRIDC